MRIKVKERKLPDGCAYGYDCSGERVCLGSKMGRCDTLPNFDPGSPLRFRMVKLRMSRCGAYDYAGAYWGIGDPIYWAYTEEYDMFLRAKSRKHAKQLIREQYPYAKFFV